MTTTAATTATTPSKSRRQVASDGSLTVRFVQEVPVLNPRAAASLYALLQGLATSIDAKGDQ